MIWDTTNILNYDVNIKISILKTLSLLELTILKLLKKSQKKIE